MISFSSGMLETSGVLNAVVDALVDAADVGAFVSDGSGGMVSACSMRRNTSSYL